MAIVNRDKDVSEQLSSYQVSTGATCVNGAVFAIACPPYPCTLVAANFAALTIANAPIVSFEKRITTGGSGFALGISGVVVGISTALAGFSGLVAPGSTLLNFAANDVLTATVSGTSAQIIGGIARAVFKRTQDIVSFSY